MKITKRQLRRIIKEQAIDYEARDKKALSDVYEILVDIDSELMIRGGDTKGYRPRLDSPPLTSDQRYAMEHANEMREQILKAIDLLESMGVAG